MTIFNTFKAFLERNGETVPEISKEDVDRANQHMIENFGFIEDRPQYLYQDPEVDNKEEKSDVYESLINYISAGYAGKITMRHTGEIEGTLKSIKRALLLAKKLEEDPSDDALTVAGRARNPNWALGAGLPTEFFPQKAMYRLIRDIIFDEVEREMK